MEKVVKEKKKLKVSGATSMSSGKHVRQHMRADLLSFSTLSHSVKVHLSNVYTRSLALGPRPPRPSL